MRPFLYLRWDVGVSGVLIHGAAGFVGVSLAARVSEWGVSTLVLVDRNPIPEWTVRLLKQRGIEVLSHQADRLVGLPLTSEITAAIALAGHSDVDYALAVPRCAFEVNLLIAMDVGEWAKAHPATRVVYISTDEVLGESFHPLDEAAPMRPTQPYAASKAAAETVLHSYRDTFSLDIVTLRSCNLVGPYQRARKLLPVAVSQLTRGAPVPVHGDGQHRREWLAVEDLCAAIELSVGQRMPPGIYHCSSEVSMSTLDVIGHVARALEVPVTVEHVSDRLVNDRSYSMDSTLMRSYGWQARYDMSGCLARIAKEMAAALTHGEPLVPSVEAWAARHAG